MVIFNIFPKDIVSKTRTIYSGRRKTEISGQRALRSKNINKIQMFLKWQELE